MAKYILNGHEPVLADLMTWARWMQKADRHVRRDELGDALVSTVFLGIDHSFRGGPPVLFETMIFWPANEELHDYQTRYVTWGEAEVGHEAALALVREAQRDHEQG